MCWREWFEICKILTEFALSDKDTLFVASVFQYESFLLIVLLVLMASSWRFSKREGLYLSYIHFSGTLVCNKIRWFFHSNMSTQLKAHWLSLKSQRMLMLILTFLIYCANNLFISIVVLNKSYQQLQHANNSNFL